jgi:hypothetical protein
MAPGKDHAARLAAVYRILLAAADRAEAGAAGGPDAARDPAPRLAVGDPVPLRPHPADAEARDD